jgi:hypothetical protein
MARETPHVRILDSAEALAKARADAATYASRAEPPPRALLQPPFLSASKVLVGSGVGLGGVLATARLMAAALRELEPLDPLTLAAGWLLIAGVGPVASFLPIRRALRVSPAQVLRME